PFAGTARCAAAGFTIGSYGFVVTGGQGSTFYTDLWMYTPSTNSWDTLAQFPALGRLNSSGWCTINNKAYVGLGWNGGYNDDYYEYTPPATLFESVNTINKGQASVQLFPNPTAGMFTLSVQNVSEKTEVEIYDISGQKIYQSGLDQAQTQINLSNEPAGIYLYRVYTKSGAVVSSGKLIIE
ncbi:MAG TPA: T9SS type A sorting domain-containing protein, partial [Bacteroidia bacterium]|nr:T9SS type A sorting domain-containing protein [Bacteroidia bacterium]